MNDDRRGASSICVRCLIAGRVQGVFFRASTRQKAQVLGLSGYARNLPDGRVEVIACGDPDAIARLREWLRHGPSQAQVSGLSCEPIPYRGYQGFTTE